MGNAYITGGFSGEINFGNTTLSSNGLNDVLIAKIDANGDFLWAKSAGGSSGGDFGLDITVDGQGNSYVTGRFVGMASFGTFTLTSNGITDVFIAKLDSNGEFLWAKGAGGTGPDIGNGIAVDSQGNSYIVGYFGFSISFGDFDLISNGMWDVFVTKLDTYGNFLWAKSAGGNDFDEGYGIDLDIQGNPYITGVICGTITIGNTSLSGLCDAFISKLNSNGEFLWTKRASGLSMVGYGLAIDNQGYSYVTGRFSGTASFDNITLTAIGDNDIFIAKLNKDTLSVIENSDVTLQIYPNPANNQISINSNSNSQIGQVEIYNLLGAKVDEVAVNNHEAVIDVSTLKAGTYFFKIYADSGVSTKKISKR